MTVLGDPASSPVCLAFLWLASDDAFMGLKQDLLLTEYLQVILVRSSGLLPAPREQATRCYVAALSTTLLCRKLPRVFCPACHFSNSFVCLSRCTSELPFLRLLLKLLRDLTTK
jgi:hypothetical protein